MTAKTKKDFKRPKAPKGISAGLREFLDDQKSTFLPDVHLEVLSYSEEFIRLSCGRRIVSFIGTGLELRCLSSSTAVVTGTILEIRYEG